MGLHSVLATGTEIPASSPGQDGQSGAEHRVLPGPAPLRLRALGSGVPNSPPLSPLQREARSRAGQSHCDNSPSGPAGLFGDALCTIRTWRRGGGPGVLLGRPPAGGQWRQPGGPSQYSTTNCFLTEADKTPPRPVRPGRSASRRHGQRRWTPVNPPRPATPSRAASPLRNDLVGRNKRPPTRQGRPAALQCLSAPPRPAQSGRPQSAPLHPLRGGGEHIISTCRRSKRTGPPTRAEGYWRMGRVVRRRPRGVDSRTVDGSLLRTRPCGTARTARARSDGATLTLT